MNAFSDKHVHVQHRFETNVFGEAVKGNPIMTVAVNARVLCCERRFLDPKRPRDPANTEHVATGHAEGGRVCVVREGGKRAACGGKIRGGFVVIEDDL